VDNIAILAYTFFVDYVGVAVGGGVFVDYTIVVDDIFCEVFFCS